MGKVALFVASMAGAVRGLFSRAFDVVDMLFVDFGYVMEHYGEPLKEFVETTVIKIEAWSQTDVGKLALTAASLSNPKLSLAISAYQTQFIPLVESQRGKTLEDAAKDLLLREVEARIRDYVDKRNRAGDWADAIEAEQAARPK